MQMSAELVFGLAYNVLYEQEKDKHPELTATDFNKWLVNSVSEKAKAKK